jgi:FtsP/CotA-like multicopper oxidase with cupredoxin domain
MLACAPPDAPNVHEHPHDSASHDSDHHDSDGEHGGSPLTFPPDAADLDPADGVVRYTLTVSPRTWAYDGQEIQGYAYNDTVPGPTLRAKVGDRVRVEITNLLADPTSVHWHGLRVPIAVDGDAWNVPAIAPGGTFVAEFVVTDPGTFWYHPHFDTERQVDLGLYGALIVTGPEEPELDQDRVILMDLPSEEGGHGAGGDHGGHGAGWLINGNILPTWTIPSGQTARLRVINVSNSGYLDLAVGEPWIVAGDQGWRGDRVEREVLGPGDRVELAIPVGNQPLTLLNHPYTVHGGAAHGEPSRLVTLEPDGSSVPPAIQLPTPQTPSADPGRTDLRYVLQGDDAGGWWINGERWPEVTIPRFVRGAEVITEVRNLSAGEHPFHLHGHRFEVLSVDGIAPNVRRIEDTLNVAIRQTVRLRWIADNPGTWMVHCHVLPHAHEGMMTAVQID